MGGAQFFWRITLLEGHGQDGVYCLEEYTLPLGEPKPKSFSALDIPYRENASGLKPEHYVHGDITPRLTYEQLIKEIPYIGDEAARKALELTKENPRAELYYERYMGI